MTKPLAQKLGIKPGNSIFVISAPKDYVTLLGPLPDGARIVTKAPQGGAALVHLFAKTMAQLQAGLPKARAAMTIDGMIWVSWYKQAAKIPTDVSEAAVRALALEGDLVDVKIAAIDDQWSGLKLMVRKALR